MDRTVTIAVTLCVVSALGYAVGALLQQHVGDRPVRVLLRTPRWWLAMGSNALGALLHVAALRAGSLMLVQALGVLTLVLAVPLAAVVTHRRVNQAGARRQGGAYRRDGVAIVSCAAGLTGLLVLTASTAATALTTRDLIVLVVVAAAALTLAAMHARGLTAAAAGGIAFGAASAVTQTLTVRLDGGAALVVLAGVAIAGLNVAGVLFTQRSYRSGLAGPLAVGTVANPVAAAAIGVVLLGERFQGGSVGVALALLCAVAVAAGVRLLSEQPRTYTAHVVRTRRRRIVARPAGRAARAVTAPVSR